LPFCVTGHFSSQDAPEVLLDHPGELIHVLVAGQ